MKAAILTGLVASLLSVTATASERGEETVKAWLIDTSKLPPIQGVQVDMTAADAARMEIIMENEKIWATEFSAPPPLGFGTRGLPMTGASGVQPELDTRIYTPIQSKPF